MEHTTTRDWVKDAGCLAVAIAPVAILLRNAMRTGASCAAFVNIFDVRLVNYFLEWGHRFVAGRAGPGASIWSPPFFYPEENVLAYSETFFSAYPFYLPARWFGASPEQALFWFVIAQLALTPAVSYLCARRLGLTRFAGLLFALCFSWSWVRYYQAAHLQFAAGWIVPLFFTCIHETFREGRLRWAAAAAWTLAYAWFMSIYVAYFLVLVTAIVALLLAAGGVRTAASAVVRTWRALRPRWVLAIACGAPLVAIGVGAYHYRLAGAVVGSKNLDEALLYQSTVWSWIRPDTSSLLWRAFALRIPGDPIAGQEKQLFLGWLALLCVFFFALRGRNGPQHRRLGAPLVWACSVCVPLAIILVARFPAPLSFLNHLYLLAFKVLPGFGALRASGRIALILSMLSCLAGALVVDLAWGRSRALAIVLAAALVAESLPPPPPVADRCAADRPWIALQPALCGIARDHGAGTLLFLPTEEISLERIFDQVPAMTIALNCGIATINGYTGKEAALVAPLLHSDPATFACPAARRALDAALQRSRLNAVVYIEREGPLGRPAYSNADVASCLRSCLSSREEIVVPGRRGEALVLAGPSCSAAR